ncbi:MAG: ABC transporter ATP-binding protein [Thermoplasmata archaeon]|nr:ABC transporter ATP-binding protein [Thermoplasmata archaeon]
MIEVINVEKKFGEITVLKNINFNINKGEIFGYLGPNGAGKTTTIRILTGIIEPTSGEIFIDRIDLKHNKKLIRSKSGLLTENPGFYERFNAIENIKFFSKLYGLNDNDIKSKIEYYFKLFNLWDHRSIPVGAFSKGMKQKLSLIRAIIHDPEYIYLDEPTASLDPETSNIVKTFIKDLKKQGKTIFLSTHNLFEAEEVCDRVAILNREIIEIGRPDELKSKIFGNRIVVEFENEPEKVKNILSTMGINFKIEGNKIIMDYEKSISSLIKNLINSGIDVSYVYRENHSLEEIYLEMVK